MVTPLRVLIVGNLKDDAPVLSAQLRAYGYEPGWEIVDSAKDMAAALASEPWDVILSDYAISGFGGLEALEVCTRSGLDIPFVLVSGAIGEEKAVQVMRAGARDYIRKDHPRLLGPVIERELREAAGRRERSQADLEIRRLNAELSRVNRELREKVTLLSRSNDDLEQFAWVVSHDLKEPLRTVSSFSQLLIKRRPNPDDPDEREFVDYIGSGVARMRALIDGLLVYSRAGRDPSESMRPADSASAAAEAVEALRGGLEDSAAIVTIDPLPPVMAAPVPLIQVFQNLVANAIKYSRDGETPSIHISAAEQDAEICFSVRDNGIGIEPEHYRRIFGLFRRLHGPEVAGIGLGLAICRRIVERYGGRIWVESEPGVGSTFFFTLPRFNAAAAASG